MKKLLDESLQKYLKQEADRLLQDAKAREPVMSADAYFFGADADEYLADRLRDLESRDTAIDMQQNADGTWIQKEE